MATVRMKRGNKYADIFDSPETIAQAEKEGFVRCEAEKKADKVVESDSDVKASEEKSVKKTPRQ